MDTIRIALLFTALAWRAPPPTRRPLAGSAAPSRPSTEYAVGKVARGSDLKIELAPNATFAT